MQVWEYRAKDGRRIIVREAKADDASLLHTGFKDVVEEYAWLPTLTPHSNISDWVNWIDRTRH
ncbi:MAG: hypothetical protein ACFFDQ_06370, partial [Candidatus Thorarchaeota archaeon]